MDVDLGWIFLNLAYAVYLVSAAFTRILQVRLVLLAATVLFIVYGVVSGVHSVV